MSETGFLQTCDRQKARVRQKRSKQAALHIKTGLSKTQKRGGGFNCSYRLVAQYVAEKKKELNLVRKEGYIPLSQDLGESQADFGSVDFIENSIRFSGKYFVLDFPYSNCGYLQLHYGGNMECLLESMRVIFEHIGGVPTEIWFVNTTTIVTKIIRGGEREITERFLRFREHYGFKVVFMNLDFSNEKGGVESKVANVKHFFTPFGTMVAKSSYRTQIAVDRAFAVRKHVTFDTRENRLTKYMLTLTAQRLEIFRKRFMKLTLVKGTPSRIRYITDKGERIELFYNPRYGRSSNQENDGKSQAATTPQKPDNVLSLTKRVPGKNGSPKGNGQQYEYVFDAKYRIGADADYKARHQGLEGPKEEDINTMHRYRDAIVYDMNRNASASNDTKQNPVDAGSGARDGIPGPFDRTMFGAYVLFPYSDEEKYKQHDFYKSIETVNIGGFPFLPSATNMVRNFLEGLISDTAESAFERATLSRGIEEKLAKVDWKKRDVLIVNVPDEEAVAACLDELSCAVKCEEISVEHLPIHYVAIYRPGIGIEQVGTVLYTQLDESGRYIFKVDAWRQLPQLIAASEFGVASVAYTNMFLLENSTAYPELHLRSEAEYRFYSELKRRVKDVDYRSEDVSGFEFAGKKIVFEGGEIRLMDGKRNPVTIKVREFERRPNAEFRRVMGYVGKVK